MVKPLALSGLKNSMYQLFIKVNKTSEDMRFPIPAEGSNYRIEIDGQDDKPGREWQGIVVQHSPEELRRHGCHFDFVLYAEEPRGGKLPRKVHANFTDMASNLARGYLSVWLQVTSTDVVATRPSNSFAKDRDLCGTPSSGGNDRHNSIRPSTRKWMRTESGSWTPTTNSPPVGNSTEASTTPSRLPWTTPSV